MTIYDGALTSSMFGTWLRAIALLKCGKGRCTRNDSQPSRLSSGKRRDFSDKSQVKHDVPEHAADFAHVEEADIFPDVELPKRQAEATVHERSASVSSVSLSLEMPPLDSGNFSNSKLIHKVYVADSPND
ncbi:hypothetical protein ACOSP7_002261 [Xanthoceras sorbifolium]